MSTNTDQFSKKIDFAKSILEHNNSLITLIDTKSGLVLGTAGIILGLLSFFERNEIGITIYPLLVTMCMLLATIIFSFCTIFPRTTKKVKKETAIFYMSIAQNTKEEFNDTIANMDEQKILKDYANNIHSLALVQEKKFGYLRISMGFMIAAIISLCITLICYHLNHLTNHT